MHQAIAKTNFDYCQKTMLLKNDLEMSYLLLGERLQRISDEKMYEPNYDTFEDFLQELNISRSTASKLINVWSRFVVGFKIKPKVLAQAGGWSKVAEILPFAENKTQALDWLIKAKTLTQADLRKELIEFRTGVEMRGCEHPEVETITFQRCLKCHESFKIYEEKH